MLFLLFQLGSDRYALEAGQVVEVLPLVTLKELPQAPRGVAGLANYRDETVPVVDLSALALGQPAAHRVSTRILMVRYSLPEGGNRLLGLVAERATEMMKCAPEDFQETGVENKDAPYLGPVLRNERGLIQRVDIKTLLNDELREALFRQSMEATP